jgi:hypothetical protein
MYKAKIVSSVAAMLFCSVASVSAQKPATPPRAPASAGVQQTARTEVAEGEYALLQQPSGDEHDSDVVSFREDWVLWRTPEGRFELEGSRHYESGTGVSHDANLSMRLSRYFQVLEAQYSPAFGGNVDPAEPACHFLPTEVRCMRADKVATGTHAPVEIGKPYAVTWPISPFTLAGLTRACPRAPGQTVNVQLIDVQQAGSASLHPLVSGGKLTYVGQERVLAAGQRWQADRYELVNSSLFFAPRMLIWTSAQGLLLAAETERDSGPSVSLQLTRIDIRQPDAITTH